MSDIFYRIVVPTDFSQGSEEAWLLARRLAAHLGSELVLVHVFSEAPLWGEGTLNAEHVRSVYESGRQWVTTRLEEWARQAHAEGRSVRTALREGVPHDEIVALATDERADLIVMGTAGRGGLGRALLGSVADRVLRLAPCPVMLVRQPE